MAGFCFNSDAGASLLSNIMAAGRNASSDSGEFEAVMARGTFALLLEPYDECTMCTRCINVVNTVRVACTARPSVLCTVDDDVTVELE